MREMTKCLHGNPVSVKGFASLTTPVYRASTIVFNDIDAYARRHESGGQGYSYGLYGTPTTRALEEKISVLHDGKHTLLVPSGQAAVAVAMLAVLSPGDHVLIPDTVYPPVRSFAADMLHKAGINVEFYDPMIGRDIGGLLGDRTRLIWVESPGSTTMEIQDLPAIVEVAHNRGVLVGCDNTWATPLLFKPLAHGADIVIEAITKYVGGHSDLLMGSITVNDSDLHKRIKSTNGLLGLGVSPEDCYLALRGLETMAVRLAHSGSVALDLAKWLTRSPTVTTVLHPALPSCPGHEIWKRDFSGSSGVFTVVFAPQYQEALYQAWDHLRFFALGASWGGTRSLAVPMDLTGARTVTTPPSGLLVRISVGLEDPDDLRSDLELLSSPSAIQEGSKELRIAG